RASSCPSPVDPTGSWRATGRRRSPSATRGPHRRCAAAPRTRPGRAGASGQRAAEPQAYPSQHFNKGLYDFGEPFVNGRGAVLSQSSLRELKSFHRALGDETRIRVVQLLANEGEQPVSSLV